MGGVYKKSFNWLIGFYYGNMPRPKPLCCLELVKKFVVVGGGGGWVCKPILVFSFALDQAEKMVNERETQLSTSFLHVVVLMKNML